ncbi:MAG: hypothetical protein NTZ97_04945 [Candidatus Moranbacteria bacterium]|nr:hypothetical protein [Candidatus Moranbacteria bacterium]
MHLDFSREIKITETEKKLYVKLRVALYILAVITYGWLGFSILFPTAYFTFSFPNPDSTKNTIINPREENGNIIQKGNVETGKKYKFDAALIGNYTKAVVSFDLNNKSASVEKGTVTLRKSYQDFFYPEGEPLDYADRYVNTNIKISGTLGSYGEAVYILADGKSYPINSTRTFVAQGYSWDDVKPIDADTLANYEKQSLFTLQSPHPNDTLLLDDQGRWYLIKDEKKYPISNVKSLDRSPIAVSTASLTTEESCQLTKQTLTKRTYVCEIPLEKFQDLLGMDYEFSFELGNTAKIDNLNIAFRRETSWANFRLKISETLTRIKNNYGYAQ